MKLSHTYLDIVHCPGVLCKHHKLPEMGSAVEAYTGIAIRPRKSCINTISTQQLCPKGFNTVAIYRILLT
jgi:hypothetical protein